MFQRHQGNKNQRYFGFAWQGEKLNPPNLKVISWKIKGAPVNIRNMASAGLFLGSYNAAYLHDPIIPVLNAAGKKYLG